MLTQFLSAPPTPRVLYLSIALVLVLSGFAIIPLQRARGAGENVETAALKSAKPHTAFSHETRERRYDDHEAHSPIPSTMRLFGGDPKLALLSFFSEDDRSSVSRSATALRTTTAPSFTSYSAPAFSPPTISLTNPTNNATFIAGSTLTLGAFASDSDGTVSKVEFFQGALKLGEDITVPYSYDWSNVAAGDYVLTARATDNAGEVTTSAVINVSVLAQMKQYVGWSSISSGIDLGSGSVRKTSTGAWDFSANSLQTLLPGDGYFESTAANYNQSLNLGGSDGTGRAVVIGSGGWVGIYENNQLVAATSSNPPVPIISAHAAGDRYRIEITNSILRYIRYRSSSREVMFTSAGALPAYPISVSLGMSPQNAEWQKTVLAQLTRKVTWSSLTNGISLGNGSVRKTSTGAWDFSANAVQTLLQGDGYFESTASMYNQSIGLGGSDGAGRSLMVGSGGWAAIYENGQEVADTSPIGNMTAHAAGDRYRIEITSGTLRYVRYRSGIRTVVYTSTNPLPAYPYNFNLGASPQNAEWQNTVMAQLSQIVSWSYITNGIDLGNGSVRKTSTGTWDFSAGPRQQLMYGPGYFESTASNYNHSINLGSLDGQGRALVAGTGGWAAVYENGQEVANTYPIQNITAHAAGDRYRLEISRGKLRYVRYRSGVRSLLFTSTNALPAYPFGYSLGASFQNTEWQNTIFSDNMPEQNDASFVSQTVATTMVPGQNYSVSVTMRNTGASTWTPDGDYQLASENLPDNQRWGLNRVNLTTTVPPGSDATFNFTVTAPATGSHSFQWRMVQQGVERFGALSTDVTVQTVNNPPTVSLTSPSNNQAFTAGATVPLAANASDPDGSVTKVEFFQGTVKLGEDTTSPYTYNWANVLAGSYVLTARATDNGGATATSSAVNITVNPPNQPPTVTLTSPANNATFTAVATIPLSANASDNDGVVNKVEFFQGAVKLGEDTTAPYSFNWTNVSAGSYVLTARATDNLGAAATSSAVNITVNQPPTVALTSPANNASFTAGSSVTFNATASDTDGTVSKVEFFQGAVKLGEDITAPYSFNWTSVPAGSYALSARATDNGGAITTSSLINITVNQPPVANAGGPYSGTSGTAVQFNGGGSSDSDGTINSYQWDFGDNTTGTGATPTHTYTTIGTRTVTLTVTDNMGATASATANATITGIINYRLEPLNQTGGEGENPLSRNFNWSVPLVGLPGRAGLDLGLSLSYNSLVWSRNGANISFNDDGGFPSPGFRLGFPVIQSLYYNSEVGKYAFLLITPDGGRTELRQVNASALYEAADSSHLLFDTATMVLRTTDGTQLSYAWKGSDYQCTQVKDRNGNFITVSYTSFGRIDTVVDTLARTIKFNYDVNNFLTSITQTWTVNGQAQQHIWATFAYTTTQTIQTNFSGLTNVGPQNNSTITVLSQVTLDDNSRFNFDYTSWGQIWKISNYAEDNHLLNYRSYNLPLNNSVAQTDCPRFTERHDWAENWNRSGSNGPAGLPAGAEQEVLTAGWAVPAAASWTMPDGSNQSGTLAQVTAADGTYNKIYFEGAAGTSTGWKRALRSLVETYDSGNVRQRQSVTAWTQDDTGLSYPLNPRVTETNVYDPAGNRVRTTITYQTVTVGDGTSCRLPQDVTEFQANATTLLRRMHTDYNSTSPYTSRRIIGLVSEKTLYQVDPNTLAETLMSKVGFAYDEDSIQGTDAPVQHDNTNYGASFLPGRGNLSSVKRYNASDVSQFTTSTMNYNTAGAVVKRVDPAGHQTLFSYTDQFSANGTTLDAARPATLAYPTMVTDPDGYTASSRYHYDFGAVTWKQTPQPNTIQNLPGPEQTLTYDSIGRIQRVTNLVNGAYTRYVYPSTQPGSPNRIDTYTTIIDGASEQNGNEAHSFQIADGHGRVIASASNHPGSDGGFSGQLVLYDNLGRGIKTSNPTETSASGTPTQWGVAGDDAPPNGFGWLYTQQTYDWKGRPLVTTNTDGTTKQASYIGCGCAGGAVVTLTDEGTMTTGEFKRRQQKIYSDVLGRTVKEETYNWDGLSVYSTTVHAYNARDQLTLTRQYAGAEGAATYQDTTLSYDGYGRLETKHSPEQQVDANNSSSSDHTTWIYNPDDTVQSELDPRGALQAFTYNNRHLVKTISYSAPAGINSTAPVSYEYDAAGNRTSMTMTNGTGSVSYEYDQLSRLKTETRIITGIGTYPLNYTYNLAGVLTGVTDPFGAHVGYNFDGAGQMTSVTGSGVSSYASNIQYRASGAQKSVTYGDAKSATTSYDARMRPSAYDFPGLREQFQYYDDGRLNQMIDLDDRPQDIGYPDTGRHFSRAHFYDQVGRLTTARGLSTTYSSFPYSQSYGYDAFNNQTGRSGSYYYQTPKSDSATYSNNRRQNWSYYADGQVKHSPLAFDAYFNESIYRDWSYDAAGRIIQVQETITNPSSVSTYTTSYDGDGQSFRESTATATYTTTGYMIRSSVLGGEVLTWLDAGGSKVKTVFKVDGRLTAVQYSYGGTNDLIWTHIDPLRMSEAGDAKPAYDPLGNLVTWQHVPSGPPPNAYPPSAASYGGLAPSFGYAINSSCILDGIPTDCNLAMNMLAHGSVEQCPNNYCGAGRARNGDLVPLTRDPDSGQLGYFSTTQHKSTPQNPTEVPVRVGGTAGLEKLLQKVLVGDCKKAMERIIDKIATSSGYAASSTDLMQLFRSLTAQTGGGGVFADIPYEAINDYVPKESALVQEEPPGGGGLSWMVLQKSGPPQRVSAIFLLSYYSDYPHKLESYQFRYFGRAAHELTHNAPEVGGRFYSHTEMDSAAKLLGSTSFDQYVKENCIPKQYW
jgi:YD repeat-containing protein